MARRDVRNARVILRQETAVDLSYYDELERMLGEEVRAIADIVRRECWGPHQTMDACRVSRWVHNLDFRPFLVDGPALQGLVCSTALLPSVFSIVQAAITLYARVRFELLTRQVVDAERLPPAEHWAGPELQVLLDAVADDREVSDGTKD